MKCEYFTNGFKKFISLCGNKGGMRIEYLDQEENKREFFLLTSSMMFDTWWKVELQINGTNTDPGRVFICESKCEQDALDAAVDYAIENEISFQHTDYYEAQDNDMTDENGDVVNCISCGNCGIYIPQEGVHISQIC